jgi:hypothetical protein
VPATPLFAEHREGACDHGRESEYDMDTDNRKKDWIGGRYRDSENDRYIFAFHER